MKPKKLFIIRHAKAEEHSILKSDFNRNLIQKGILRATKIAQMLGEKYLIDEKTLFVSSSANRAIQTANIFASILNFPLMSIIQTKNIYEAYYQDILKELNRIPNNIDTVFLFGHNPGLSDLTNYLCNSYISLKTAELAEINIEEGLYFSELSGNTATLKRIISE